MRRPALFQIVLYVLVLCGTALADDADNPSPTVLEGRITDVLGKPIADARIYVLPRSGGRLETKTSQDGRYSMQLASDGAHGVVIGVEKVHTFRQVLIQRGTSTTLDVEVEIDTAGGEVIKIVDRKLPPPKVMPKPVNDAQKALPYSEEAVERDAWARAWLLLDIDETGTVTRLKLLKRPGFDLDQIAIDEAFKLKFEPARDATGRPVRTYLIWTMEWPSWGWLIQGNGVIGRINNEDEAIHQVPQNHGGGLRSVSDSPEGIQRANDGINTRSQSAIVENNHNLARANWAQPGVVVFPNTLSRVPCAGSGPLNLDLRNRAYRDCSQPDMSTADALPWITRENKTTALAELARTYKSAELVPYNGSRVPELIASGVTGGLAIAMIYSYVQFTKYSDRLHDSTWTTDDAEQVASYTHSAERWKRMTIGLTGAVIVSGAVTGFLWSRHQTSSAFSVQPNSGGAAVSYGGSF